MNIRITTKRCTETGEQSFNRRNKNAMSMKQISIANLELLKQTESREVIIVSYAFVVEKQRKQLKKDLEAEGFRVRYAGDCDGLMSGYFNFWANHSTGIAKRLLKKASGVVTSCLRRGETENDIERPAKDGRIFLLPSFEPGNWLIEAFQVYLKKHGLEDRLYLYDSEEQQLVKPDKPVLGYFEYHVSWQCNLKCKGCTHYSNLFREKLFGDLKQYKKDLNRLRELFSNIDMIHLLGGEPLLNKELPDFIKATREAFPRTSLWVVSNGLLIPRAESELFRVMREQRAKFEISNYPPTQEMKSEIQRILKNESIEYTISDPIQSFYSVISGETGDINKNFHDCEARCHFLQDGGKLGVCGEPIWRRQSQQFLSKQLEVTDTDYIDIYQVKNGYEILERFMKPIPYCRYCNFEKKYVFEWQGNYTKELEWDK